MLTTILVLVALGILAILAELVLPAGILGVAGAIALMAAVVLIFNDYGMATGLAAFIALLVFGFAVFWYWMKYFHRLPFTRKMVHQTEVGDDEGRSEMKSMAGKSGHALTDLRPSGRALIDGERVDVIAESGIIEKGSNLRVISVSGATLMVRAAE
jgi:membrane-bound serine protease (ClpP class)